jgi:Astacin (Peptidase family M12A)
LKITYFEKIIQKTKIMKKTNWSTLLLSSVLLMCIASCEKNNEADVATDNVDSKVINESYNPTATGETIDAIYNGVDVKLLEIDNGKYLYDGDIVLERADFTLPGELGKGVFSGGNWPSRTIRWKYDGNPLPSFKNKWAGAMAAWRRDLRFNFVQITGNSGDYILVRENFARQAYSTSVGRKGGQQIIDIDPSVYQTGSYIHEIGHAVGLNHEHSRPDRGRYIRVITSNIKRTWIPQYSVCGGCRAGGSFDFNSIMLYGSYASAETAVNTSRPVMTRLNGSTWTANTSGLSAGDKAAVNAKYR